MVFFKHFEANITLYKYTSVGMYTETNVDFTKGAVFCLKLVN